MQAQGKTFVATRETTGLEATSIDRFLRKHPSVRRMLERVCTRVVSGHEGANVWVSAVHCAAVGREREEPQVIGVLVHIGSHRSGCLKKMHKH